MNHSIRYCMMKASVVSIALAAISTAALAADPEFVTTPQGVRIPLQAAPVPLKSPDERPAYERIIRKPTLLPSAVDLTPYQTPVKNQGGRDTCGTFATVAALEAAYVRNYSLTLDLSEQYLNHWGQILAGAGSGALLPQSEVQAGAIGGGGMARPLAALGKGMGVPPESVLPYVTDGAYQDANPGDQPLVTDWWTAHPQRVMDDFNLADAPADYVFSPPTHVTTTIMPQAALEQARYRTTGITYLTGAEVGDLDTYRAILAAHHEVIIEMRCCDGQPGWNNTAPWNLPAGSNGGGSGHVMVIVGYDDATQMFRVKNSWTTAWADHGYVWLSYDFVRRNVITGAAYLQGVVQPGATFNVWNNQQLWLGRWNLDFDGWKAALNLYNLPAAATPSPQPGGNYRVGTLFMADGRIHRVNGVINGNKLDFWVDWQNANQPASQLSGAHFTTYLFSWDHQSMAGFVREGSGPTFAVEAVKVPATLAGVARSGHLSVKSYLGVWNFNHDGWHGRLEVISANPMTRRLTGRYVDSNGVAFNMTGQVNRDHRLFSLVIGFAAPQPFDGFLNGHELGVMSGTTQWNGMTFGFFGTRQH
jgi:hypothetical protein